MLSAARFWCKRVLDHYSFAGPLFLLSKFLVQSHFPFIICVNRVARGWPGTAACPGSSSYCGAASGAGAVFPFSSSESRFQEEGHAYE
jgi:hypothetical protein